MARYHHAPLALLLPLAAALTGCTDPAETTTTTTTDDGPEGLAILGGYTHDLAELEVTVVADAADGVDRPRDLAFNPDAPEQLWILNNADHSALIVSNPGEADQEVLRKWDAYGVHFLAKPAALAFGASGTLATAHEEDDYTQGTATPKDFMGPTLWTSDVDDFDAGHTGHLDMLHNSPNAVGIAWERDNVYWVFDGYHASITRYDFQDDHDLGGTDHTDGVIDRYVEGEVSYVEGVSSHMVFHEGTGWLFIADSGNGRIAALDTRTGERGSRLTPNYDGGDQYHVDGGEIWTVVDGSEHNVYQPSGLALRDNVLYTTDASTGIIVAFNLDGMLLDWLDTGLPADALQGIDFDEAGNLYVVDAEGDEIWRISAPAE